MRDGWNVAVAYGDAAARARRGSRRRGLDRRLGLGKFELQARRDALGAFVAEAGDGATLELGARLARRGRLVVPADPDRALVLCDPAATAELRARLAASLPARRSARTCVDVTTQYGALTLCGPPAREIFARFCALDLRAQSLPVRGLRPGSVARTPGLVLREDEQRFLMLFGWALGEYMWTVVADAGRHLGARPLGVDALAPLHARRRARLPCVTSSGIGACGAAAASCATPMTS